MKPSTSWRSRGAGTRHSLLDVTRHAGGARCNDVACWLSTQRNAYAQRASRHPFPSKVSACKAETKTSVVPKHGVYADARERYRRSRGPRMCPWPPRCRHMCALCGWRQCDLIFDHDGERICGECAVAPDPAGSVDIQMGCPEPLSGDELFREAAEETTLCTGDDLSGLLETCTTAAKVPCECHQRSAFPQAKASHQRGNLCFCESFGGSASIAQGQGREASEASANCSDPRTGQAPPGRCAHCGNPTDSANIQTCCYCRRLVCHFICRAVRESQCPRRDEIGSSDDEGGEIRKNIEEMS